MITNCFDYFINKHICLCKSCTNDAMSLGIKGILLLIAGFQFATICTPAVATGAIATMIDQTAATQQAAESLPEMDLAKHELSRQWSLAQPKLLLSLNAGLGDGSTGSLYSTQLQTANLLLLADATNDLGILEGLADLYAAAFPYASAAKQMKFYYVPNRLKLLPSKRVSSIALPYSIRAWIPHDAQGTPQPESILDSVQFLYAATRLLRALASRKVMLQQSSLRRYAEDTWALAVDHLERWILKTDFPGSFQTEGWGCSQGTFSHSEHVRNLTMRAYGSRALPRASSGTPPAYCNAVIDVDLFIFALIGELLIIDANELSFLKLPLTTKKQLVKHLRHGLELVHSRLSRTNIRLQGQADIHGLLMDKGLWDSYPDYRWSGYEGSIFPGWQVSTESPALSEQPAYGTGWDLSHARRFVQFLDTLESLEQHGVHTIITSKERQEIASQILLASWNQSEETPRFANYVSGHNGWYRVNYANRPAYGIAPFGFEKDVIGSGYGHWAQYSPLMSKILISRAVLDLNAPPDDFQDSTYQIQWLASLVLIQFYSGL